MRQFYYPFLFLFAATQVFGQQPDLGVMSIRLQEALTAQSNDFHHISILLTDRVDMRAMDQAFYSQNASLSTRSQVVIATLKEKAKNTQTPITDLLNASGAIEPGSIQPFWVTNLLFVKAKKSIIEELSRMQEIEWLDLNAQLELDEYVDGVCIPNTSPGTPEPGLKAIKADKLWQMGYTGRGTVAMTADTGVDPNHPAIAGNWRALSVPQEQAWFDPTNTNNSTPSNCGDHGTHTLGTMVGIDRVTKDTIGVAFNGEWIGSNILCSAQGTLHNIASFQWALDPDGDPTTTADMPTVINNSWFDPLMQPGEDCTSAYVDILNTMETSGIAVVFSAGNSGSGPSTITTPKNINTDLVNLMCVAAVNGNNSNLPVAGFSSRGPSLCGGMNSLLIKPEVAAPGENVRSCELDGTYGQKSGTSMAAPHVCGAIMLLKEAFPDLTGTELKLALYFSCTDLGTAGEDNTYGMGIINVLGAFNYLVDAGNTPIDPLVNNDVLLIDIDAKRLNCNGVTNFDIVIENGGTLPLTSTNITYSFVATNGITALENTIEWTGNLPTGEREAVNINVDSAPEGAYEIVAVASDPNGMVDAYESNNTVSGAEVLISEQLPLTVEAFDGGSVEPCIGSSTYLTVNYDGEADIQWFFSEVGGNPIAEGNTYLVPGLLSDFTFYVDAIVTSKVGIENLDQATSAVADNNEGRLIFDAFTSFLLKSVKVYVDEVGFRQITLRGSDGQQIAQKIFNLQELGEQRLDLNISIDEGKDYSLEINAGMGFSYTTAANYPYVIGNVLSIKRSGDFVDPQTNYYYFYDWEIEHKHVCGRSAYTVEYQSTDLVPEADFEPSAESVSIDDGEVSFTNTSVNGVTYAWNFGDGNTSTLENPVHNFTEIGTYTVLLTVVNVDGCSDAIIKTIEVTSTVLAIEPLIEEQSIKVFPNPTTSKLEVLFDFNSTQQIDIQLRDMLGRLVLDLGTKAYAQDQIDLDLSAYSSGVYFLVCQVKDQKIVKKIIKMN